MCQSTSFSLLGWDKHQAEACTLTLESVAYCFLIRQTRSIHNIPLNSCGKIRNCERNLPGTFITFEGIDGSGKSTQLRLLANFLASKNCHPLLTREPGGTPVGNRLRAALLDAQEEVDPLAELLVFAADRAQHVRRVLRPALEKGQVVFSDRYADATAAYQGAGRGFSATLITEIIDLATEGLKPDLTVLFDLPVQESGWRTRRRSDGKRKSDRLDGETEDFHERVREEYLRIARNDPQRVKVVETNRPMEETQQRVKEIIVPFLISRGHLAAENVEQVVRFKFCRVDTMFDQLVGNERVKGLLLRTLAIRTFTWRPFIHGRRRRREKAVCTRAGASTKLPGAEWR